MLLLGPNGSGKTTLLRALAGFKELTEGRLFWRDKPLSHDSFDLEMNGRINFLGALEDGLVAQWTVFENLHFWGFLFEGSSNRVDHMISRFQLEQLLDQRILSLSSGQRRRVSMARIASSPCPIWLLDEPTIALDKAGIALLERTIQEHRQDGGIVVIATHADVKLDDATTLYL